jgi:hypothetical protein
MTRNSLRQLPPIALPSFVFFSTMVLWSVFLTLSLIRNGSTRYGVEATQIVRDHQLCFARRAGARRAERGKNVKGRLPIGVPDYVACFALLDRPGRLLAGSTGEPTRVAANDMAPAPSILR